MNDLDAAIIAAKARADRQRTHVNGTIEILRDEARDLMTRYDATEAWSLLVRKISEQLGLHDHYQRSAAEMLAELVVRQIEAERAKTAPEPFGPIGS